MSDDAKTRWDGDENLKGIATGRAFAPDVEKLQALMSEPDWIAEEAQIHLYPHIFHSVDAIDSLQIVRAEEIPHGIYEVKLRWEPTNSEAEKLVSHVYSIIGSFAEFCTSVTQKFVDEEIHFEVATGMPPDKTRFKTHGHLVRLRVTGEAAADAAANYIAFLEGAENEDSSVAAATSSEAPEADAAERAGPS